MSEIRHYTVKQERSVKVVANSPTDAVRIAEAAFRNGQNSDCGVKDGPEGIWGNTLSRVREVSMYVEED